MRRKDREVTGRENLEAILAACPIMRIGLVDEEGIYVVPVNYSYEYEGDDLVLYFHGDILTKLGDKDIPSYSELQSAMSGYNVGDTVTVTYVRGDSTQTASIVLQEAPAEADDQ